jgi:hypothetical protein
MILHSSQSSILVHDHGFTSRVRPLCSPLFHDIVCRPRPSNSDELDGGENGRIFEGQVLDLGPPMSWQSLDVVKLYENKGGWATGDERTFI